jgi:murein endopeptidase
VVGAPPPTRRHATAVVPAVVITLAAAAATWALAGRDDPDHDRVAPAPAFHGSRAERRPEPREPRPAPPHVTERIRWRHSVAIGGPSAGRLVRGVRLPAAGAFFFTWDPVLRRSPNRAWRRWGTAHLVRVLLRLAREYHRAHPGAPRMAIGDLSRPHGGDFGPQFGYIGHASHQNGLDADVYYPRSDGRERAPRDATEIDRRLSQELVDRFVAAGAVLVLVGPGTGLTGPRVEILANHDNHLHVRLPA